MPITCPFCNRCDENIEHLFCKCPEVTKLWENVQQWIDNTIRKNITFTDLMKLVGYIKMDNNFWPLHLLLTTTRNYIFWCSKKGYKLNVFHLQKEIKRVFSRAKNLKPDEYPN